MLHCDEETLSLLALGEAAADADAAHVAGCERCSTELAALRQVVLIARTDELHLDDVPRVAPPPGVWDQIAAATGVQAIPNVPAAEPTAKPGIHPGGGPVAERRQESDRPPSGVPALPRQRSWRSRLDGRLLAVAAGCLVLGLLAGVIGTRTLSDGSDPDRSRVVAATELTGLPAAPAASGQADVTQSAQGRTLDLGVRELGAPDGFYEVWLIDPTVTKMVPIGVLSGSEGRFTLPAGVNLADYPIVDVSIEPLDGNPTHSGQSVLRGTLKS